MPSVRKKRSYRPLRGVVLDVNVGWRTGVSREHPINCGASGDADALACSPSCKGEWVNGARTRRYLCDLTARQHGRHWFSTEDVTTFWSGLSGTAHAVRGVGLAGVVVGGAGLGWPVVGGVEGGVNRGVGTMARLALPRMATGLPSMMSAARSETAPAQAHSDETRPGPAAPFAITAPVTRQKI